MRRLDTCVQYAVCLLAATMMLSCSVVATGQEPDDSSGELKKVLADLCSKHDVPSLTISVVRSDEIVATVCSGVRKVGSKDAVELTDRQALGSNTKSMTATLAAILVESGKIDWDTTISEVWPTAGNKHLHPKLRDVTLDELIRRHLDYSRQRFRRHCFDQSRRKL